MTELHERFAEGLFEEKSEKLKLHRGENKQSHRAEEQKSEANKINHIKIELLNMLPLALELPVSKLAEKPNLTHSGNTISFLDIIEIILKMIVEGAKAIFPKRKEKN
jgi:hypothetical protein